MSFARTNSVCTAVSSSFSHISISSDYNNRSAFQHPKHFYGNNLQHACSFVNKTKLRYKFANLYIGISITPSDNAREQNACIFAAIEKLTSQSCKQRSQRCLSMVSKNKIYVNSCNKILLQRNCISG